MLAREGAHTSLLVAEQDEPLGFLGVDGVVQPAAPLETAALDAAVLDSGSDRESPDDEDSSEVAASRASAKGPVAR
jgi:hypothetical protein